MKKQNFRYKNSVVDPNHGGFSQIWVWQCYFIFFSLIILFTPFFGMPFCFIFFGMFAVWLAQKKMAKEPPEVQIYDYLKWRVDFDYALEHDLDLPDLDDYKFPAPVIAQPLPQKPTEVKTPAQPKLKSPKTKKLPANLLPTPANI